MWQGLRTGVIEKIGSDHTPNYSKVKGLPVLYSEGVLKGRLSLEHMVEAPCTNPPKSFGLYPQKRTIQVGSDADLSLPDPTVEW